MVFSDRQYAGELWRDPLVTLCRGESGGLAPTSSGTPPLALYSTGSPLAASRLTVKVAVPAASFTLTSSIEIAGGAIGGATFGWFMHRFGVKRATVTALGLAVLAVIHFGFLKPSFVGTRIFIGKP